MKHSHICISITYINLPLLSLETFNPITIADGTKSILFPCHPHTAMSLCFLCGASVYFTTWQNPLQLSSSRPKVTSSPRLPKALSSRPRLITASALSLLINSGKQDLSLAFRNSRNLACCAKYLTKQIAYPGLVVLLGIYEGALG